MLLSQMSTGSNVSDVGIPWEVLSSWRVGCSTVILWGDACLLGSFLASCVAFVSEMFVWFCVTSDVGDDDDEDEVDFDEVVVVVVVEVVSVLLGGEIKQSVRDFGGRVVVVVVVEELLFLGGEDWGEWEFLLCLVRSWWWTLLSFGELDLLVFFLF